MVANGFEKAYANMLMQEAEKKAKKDFINSKVEELVAQGLDETVAKVMVKTMFEYGLINSCGFVEA